ncbi:amidohydrolase family protein [Parathalassolituus penaei]|uniref:Amidohydrolase family protein n=1 Tax=Parathalassolituus penaei TaxID=2997323 RepID=A0A9X3EMJ1_9GAMM|nr:amidohydrolase family protein [Parathalassolituus penaei]MCY0965413.1 amidohydrolase family protein [Parathalassolituus penaei]
MSLFAARKIDCHNHIFDPQRFPYQPDTPYRPLDCESSPANLFHQVLDIHGVSHALLVGPNSGYGENDNRALLDAIAGSNGRFRGMAVVSQDVSVETLAALKAQGVVGVTFNVAYYGLEHFAASDALLGKLADLEMLAQVQTQDDQMLGLAPMLKRHPVRVVVDHCGRPNLGDGVDGKGFQAVLDLAENGRTWIKVSGFAKFSRQSAPWLDVDPYVAAICEAYGAERCLWGSDWPFLKALERMDYGVMVQLVKRHFPDAEEREAYLWRNAASLFGFDEM